MKSLNEKEEDSQVLSNEIGGGKYGCNGFSENYFHIQIPNKLRKSAPVHDNEKQRGRAIRKKKKGGGGGWGGVNINKNL
jgi:hypothetical protein